MELNAGLERVMREVAEALDSAAGSGPDRGRAEGKCNLLTVASKLTEILDPAHPGLVCIHRGRAVSVTLHRGSEMKLIVHCDSPCRFRIVRNTFASRLNALAGRRVHFGASMIDTEYLARIAGPYEFETFLQRSDVGAFIDFFRPFYSITGEPGSVHVISDFSANSIRAGEIIDKLERAIEFAKMLEDEFTDESAILQMKEQGGGRGKGSAE